MTKITNSEALDSENQQTKFFPIRTVSELTGVNSITLRAWERRYGLLVPHRTPKGHRLYTQDDIDLIHQAVELLNKGVSISQAKHHLLPQKLQKKKRTSKKVEDTANTWDQYQKRILNAIVRFDNNSLIQTYNDILSIYPLDIVMTHLILPISRLLGRRWDNGDGTIAEEHFFTLFLRNKIGARFHHQSSKLTGPKIIAACFSQEQHEIGLLIFCLAATDHGYEVVSLGSDLPLEELILVAKQANADAIILSGTNELSTDILKEDLSNLVNSIDIPTFVGGDVSIKYFDSIVSAGAHPIGQDIQHALREIDLAIKLE